ncbi:amidase family protein [Phenylobacterium sp.]|jgi:amidase|uniref:amidase family protein n=1 Tax=Phenylobacterium sp. TaxID=1871053 RepID=UPI002E34627A|nr:amidase family protein [Phenylobacterium sp.]HEX3366376.1 amidase family protein [Phenylobacterium sp.]
MDDILQSDATEQLSALEAGRVSASELLQAEFDRTDKLNPAINAVIARDAERAISDAAAVDAARARGEALGVLAGLPMTVKDIFDIEGLPASVGMKSLLGRPAKDADAVARVRATGALVWGHTNVPAGSSDFQTYNALYGVTRNPWNLGRTPGGSSGGAAAAVAAGFTALEVGADIGGSLRIPAGFCGIACHRPSWGLISQRGIAAPPGYLSDYDLLVVGPMARSVRDLQLLLTVLADVAVSPTPTLASLRIGLWLDEPTFPIDPEVRTVIEAFAGELQGEGVAVDPVTLPIAAREMLSTYMTLLLAAISGVLGPATRAVFDLFRGPAKLAEVCGAGHLSWAHGVLGYTARHHEWLAASEERARMTARVAQAFALYDAILAPVTPTTAFAHNHAGTQATRWLSMSDGGRIRYLEQVDWIALAILCDLPVTVIPVGLAPEGMPVAVQIIGRPGSDAATLAIASALETVTGGFRPPPTLMKGVRRPLDPLRLDSRRAGHGRPANCEPRRYLATATPLAL